MNKKELCHAIYTIMTKWVEFDLSDLETLMQIAKVLQQARF